MWRALFAGLVASSVAIDFTSDEFKNECAAGVLDATALDEKLAAAFKAEYKATAIRTDWMQNTTAKVVEVSSPGSLGVSVSSRSAPTQQWITQNNQTRWFNASDATCSTSPPSPPLAVSARIAALFAAKGDSLKELVDGLVAWGGTNKGQLMGSRVVAGVEGVRWLACVNGTGNETGVQIEVVYAGDRSLKPPSASFDNPLILSVSLAEVKNISDNSTDPIFRQSFEFDLLETVTPSDVKQATTVPPGVVCAGVSTAPLNASLPEKLAVQAEGREGSVKLVVSGSVLSAEASTVSGRVPWLGEDGLPEGRVRVVHDFDSGYSYALGPSGVCLRQSALSSEKMRDVVDKEGFVSMASPVGLFVNQSSQWAGYGTVTLGAETLSVWRSAAADGKTVEALTNDGVLKQVNEYAKNGSVYTLSSWLSLVSLDGETVDMSGVAHCYTPAEENSTATFDVKQKSLKDVFTVGESSVVDAIAVELRALGAVVNPARLRVFFQSKPSSLGVFVTVSEPSTIAPGKVNGTSNETAVAEVIAKLNETIFTQEMKLPVAGADWTVEQHSFLPYPAPPPPPGPEPYVGYSGGSMFVLAVFMLLGGVAVGAGGLFFLTKRQRLTTLAYQVFE